MQRLTISGQTVYDRERRGRAIAYSNYTRF